MPVLTTIPTEKRRGRRNTLLNPAARLEASLSPAQQEAQTRAKAIAQELAQRPLTDTEREELARYLRLKSRVERTGITSLSPRQFADLSRLSILFGSRLHEA